jgi:predicted TIM-barrel fold metal-dependent hydrolase
VDISDRDNELGRQPYTARDFFIKYQDRILFGTDLYPEAHIYRAYFRFLETADEYFDYSRHYYKHGRWKIYGLGLPDEVLRKVYYANAARLLQLDPSRIEASN